MRVARSKQYSGFHFNRQFGTRLWQRYGFEREYPFVGSSEYTLSELIASTHASNGFDDQ